ncbi:hypothetical protein [Pseudarthrobacter oxydans]|uniref:hypothetical protein n=1 Tax=Pseudarthrobacter oxydans TaxID=1671 RepID=UPI0035EAAA1E|nr:hypothetical protein GCM10017547_38680 [Pseudarthrobacter oxydans]
MASRVTIQNLTIVRGDDETILITVSQNGSPVDITGSTLFFTAKQTATDADADAVISAENSSHTDAAGGVSFIALTHTLTSVEPSTYHYDIQWVDDSGNVKTILKGKLTVEQDITTRTA